MKPMEPLCRHHFPDPLVCLWDACYGYGTDGEPKSWVLLGTQGGHNSPLLGSHQASGLTEGTNGQEPPPSVGPHPCCWPSLGVLEMGLPPPRTAPSSQLWSRASRTVTGAGPAGPSWAVATPHKQRPQHRHLRLAPLTLPPGPGGDRPGPDLGGRNPHACTQGAELLRAGVEPTSEPQNATPSPSREAGTHSRPICMFYSHKAGGVSRGPGRAEGPSSGQGCTPGSRVCPTSGWFSGRPSWVPDGRLRGARAGAGRGVRLWVTGNRVGPSR